MVYKAEYHYDGNYGLGMNYLNPGDVVELPDGNRFKILWVKKHGRELVYNTDTMGLIYARELKRIG